MSGMFWTGVRPKGDTRDARSSCGLLASGAAILLVAGGAETCLWFGGGPWLAMLLLAGGAMQLCHALPIRHGRYRNCSIIIGLLWSASGTVFLIERGIGDGLAILFAMLLLGQAGAGRCWSEGLMHTGRGWLFASGVATIVASTLILLLGLGHLSTGTIIILLLAVAMEGLALMIADTMPDTADRLRAGI